MQCVGHGRSRQRQVPAQKLLPHPSCGNGTFARRVSKVLVIGGGMRYPFSYPGGLSIIANKTSSLGPVTCRFYPSLPCTAAHLALSTPHASRADSSASTPNTCAGAGITRQNRSQWHGTLQHKQLGSNMRTPYAACPHQQIQHHGNPLRPPPAALHGAHAPFLARPTTVAVPTRPFFPRHPPPRRP